MLIPMNQTPVLIESSFLDAIAIIAAADELPKQTQRHWTTSLRQIAKALDKPLELIPARLGAVRADLARLHHLPTGLMLKTLRNHKSNVKSALLWLAKEKRIPKHGAPLPPAWEALESRAEVKSGGTAEDFLARLRHKSEYAATLEQHLAWLREAGFAATCLHLQLNRALVAGVKPAS